MDSGRQGAAAGSALRRLLISALSFALMWCVLALLGELTVATKLVMSSLAGIAVLLLGPRIWEWIAITFPLDFEKEITSPATTGYHL